MEHLAIAHNGCRDMRKHRGYRMHPALYNPDPENHSPFQPWRGAL